ncbi:hypothetical protein Tco_0888896, partial [Tanacetum coccineum]
ELLQGKTTKASSTNSFNIVSTLVNAASAPRSSNDAGPSFVPLGGPYLDTYNSPFTDQVMGAEADFNNMEPSTIGSYIVVPVFQKGDDPIDAINHMMSFLTAVVTSRYPTTNNQLKTSSNPRQQATIYDGKVTVQPVQGRQTTYAAGTTRK